MGPCYRSRFARARLADVATCQAESDSFPACACKAWYLELTWKSRAGQSWQRFCWVRGGSFMHLPDIGRRLLTLEYRQRRSPERQRWPLLETRQTVRDRGRRRVNTGRRCGLRKQVRMRQERKAQTAR